MSFISSFETISAVIPEQCIFFWILVFIADAATVISNGAKLFFVNRTATFIDGPAVLLKNAPKKPPKLFLKITELF